MSVGVQHKVQVLKSGAAVFVVGVCLSHWREVWEGAPVLKRTSEHNLRRYTLNALNNTLITHA